jgi:hypothetical protein
VLNRSLNEPRRAALAVLARGTSPTEQARAIEWVSAQPAERVVEALASDLVDQLFLRAAEESGLAGRLPARLVELLTARRLWVAANVLMQQHVLGEACALLEELGGEYVVFKGALLRRILYAEPYLRPSADLDLLVTPDRVKSAALLFAERGYSVLLEARSDTHELLLARQGVYVDLHWCLLRPGRMRQDITRELVEGRVRQSGLWGPNETLQTVVMLVHPAITDHVTGRLASAVDLDLWLRCHPVCWDEVLEVLGRIGLRTAAWAMLVWTRRLFGTPVPSEVWRELAPGTLRRRYLEHWLELHLNETYRQRPWLVRGAFSLPLQDRVLDAARALWMLARKRRLSL